ncbi:hypothetical protein [Noviherbaspirillum aridicola]|uniref:Uncharacterized protein n=1 Tax=Noviherbaspirillum aridicola TaxID=2849687 RepID=A0ABQ4Q908_9BURK|nr:hypothetical protein [Noviherbaspirillum aridicola]GIZ53638.1 hypothetical protein NCCP691_36520 [Noviherbaspirillum aridicola]
MTALEAVLHGVGLFALFRIYPSVEKGTMRAAFAWAALSWAAFSARVIFFGENVSWFEKPGWIAAHTALCFGVIPLVRWEAGRRNRRKQRE